MFPSTANPSGHISPGWISRLVRRRAAEIGVVMHYHRLRHRYGTAVHRARRDLLVTQQRLRHRDPASTAGYALIADDHGHAVVDELPGAIPAPRPATELETAA
jgi:site-specific recombinase XerC